jgi:spore coat polysaccharide biosynthesis protein SpsF (cytidylyltransferase family)
MTSINRINPALDLGFVKVKIWRTVERTADFAAVESPALPSKAEVIAQAILANAAELRANRIEWTEFLTNQHSWWTLARANGLGDAVGILLSRYNRNI